MRTEKATRFYLTGILSLAIILSVYGGGVFAKQEGRLQKVCPILGGEIDKSVYEDYAGNRVYFCCPGCKTTFMENPEKYIEDMESEGIELEKVPSAEAGEKPKHSGARGEDHSGMGHGDDHPHGATTH